MADQADAAPQPVAWHWVEDPYGANDHHTVYEDPQDARFAPLYAAPPDAEAIRQGERERAQARIAALEAVIKAHNAKLTHACVTHPFTARCAALSKDGECLYCPMRFAIELPA